MSHSSQAVYEELGRERPEGLHYATFRLPDGLSFMHIVIESDQPGRVLNEIAAFKAFTATSRTAATSRRSRRRSR